LICNSSEITWIFSLGIYGLFRPNQAGTSNQSISIKQKAKMFLNNEIDNFTKTDLKNLQKKDKKLAKQVKAELK